MGAGTAPAARTAASLSRPTSIPTGAEAVRDERRLQRDDRPSSSRAARTSGETSTSSFTRLKLRHRAELLHAAGCGFERQVRPADDVARGERVLSRRVDDSFDGLGFTIVPVEGAARAPSFKIHVTAASGPWTIRCSSSFAKTTSGSSSITNPRNASAPESRIALQDARSTLTRAPLLRARRRAWRRSGRARA